MRAVSHLWRLLILVPLAACTGGGGSGPSGNGSSSTGGGGDPDADGCRLTATLSGGLEGSFTGDAAVCAYTSRAVTLTQIDGAGIVATVSFDDIEPFETGTFAARIDIRKKPDDWRGAVCSLEVTSHVQTGGTDGGTSIHDRYLIKGTGTCSTPAEYRAPDGGTPKEPVTIAPFTFSLRTLLY